MNISREQVERASAAWIYVPSTAGRIESAEYLALRYPIWYEHPLQLIAILPDRPLEVVLDEVLERCRGAVGHARAEVLCWVRLGAPAGLEAALIARRGRLVETTQVLARSLPFAASEVPDDVDIRWSDTFDVFVDAVRVGTEVFGGTSPDSEALLPIFEEERAKVASGAGGSVVAYLDGRAVGTGGVTVAGPDARLWSGGVLPEARGRGIYRTLLAERLAYGATHGAALALVKGRVETSAPILRRAGFSSFGEERSYLLPL